MEKLSDRLRTIANEMDNHSEGAPVQITEDMIEKFHKDFIRPIMESRILKLREVARMLHVSPSTVGALIDNNFLPTTADGKITEYHLWLYLSNSKKLQNM